MPIRRPRGRLGAVTVGLVLSLLAFTSSGARADTVTVFAAASLKTALEEAADLHRGGSDTTVTLAFAGSSALARQIEHGAPADIFISANPDWMDRLEARGLIDPASRFDLFGNRLVLIAHGADAAPVEIGPALPLAEMLGEARLAMALVDAVPAGIYGKAALTSYGLWDDVATRVAQADNVRAALALVATGATPLGIVYRTDASVEPRVTVVGTFPEDSHPPIVYPVAAVGTDPSGGAVAFLAFLRQPETTAVFARHGFAILGE